MPSHYLEQIGGFTFFWLAKFYEMYRIARFFPQIHILPIFSTDYFCNTKPCNKPLDPLIIP